MGTNKAVKLGEENLTLQPSISSSRKRTLYHNGLEEKWGIKISNQYSPWLPVLISSRQQNCCPHQEEGP
uniref:Two-component response regulator-like APRR2 isoform X1 n=1 Tax=Rhizophora mucronata TaxID=61149 RepID=A0A2P2M053_RHIMU